VTLRDRFTVPSPGEVELVVEDSPGVTIERAHVGDLDDPGNDFRMIGAAGPLADDGLELVFVAGDRAAVTADGACAQPARDGRRWLSWALVGAAAAVALAATAIVVVRRRRRAR
jgi:hypothetical protein